MEINWDKPIRSTLYKKKMVVIGKWFGKDCRRVKEVFGKGYNIIDENGRACGPNYFCRNYVENIPDNENKLERLKNWLLSCCYTFRWYYYMPRRCITIRRKMGKWYWN